MLGKQHRTPVSAPSRILMEKAAARKFLHSTSTDADHAISMASDRLWRHARRSMQTPHTTGCIIICPDILAQDPSLSPEEGEDCITEAVGV